MKTKDMFFAVTSNGLENVPKTEAGFVCINLYNELLELYTKSLINVIASETENEQLREIIENSGVDADEILKEM